MAALSHPSILAIHELAVVDGLSLAVMELLEGESLRQRLARGPVPWREAAALAQQAAEGLAAAHAKGIVHRDVKPENLFLLAGGRLKILDFGLARSTSSRLSDPNATRPAMTRAGTVFGSIGYMAPEQVLGEPAGPAADLFALGCVLHELVTGARPFARETPSDTLSAVLSAPAPSLQQSVPDVPAGLEQIVAHCLAKAPTARFDSARDLASALQSLLADSSVTSGTVGRKRRSRAAPRSIAVLPFANSGEPDADYLADGLTEDIINSLSQLPRVRVVPRSTVFQFKGRHVEPTSVALALNVRSLVTGRVVKRGDVLTIQAELIDAATESQIWGHQYRYSMTDVLAMQEEIAWHISEALRLKLTGEQRKRLKRRATGDSEAYHEYLRGRHQWGRWNAEGFARAIAHFERAIDRDPAFALAWSGLADALAVSGYYAHIPQAEAMPRALFAARRALEIDPALGEAHAAMGLALMFFEWDLTGADAAFGKAIERNPRLAVAYAYRALLLAAERQSEEAIEATRRAFELEPLSLLMNQTRCWVLYFAGQYEAALAQAAQVMALDEGFPEAHSMVIACNEIMGRLDRAAEEWPRTITLFGLPIGQTTRMIEALARGGATAYWEERLAVGRELPASLGGGALLAQAIPLARLGRVDEAIALLEQLVAGRHPHAIFLAVDPFASVLHAHPGFQALLKRVGVG